MSFNFLDVLENYEKENISKVKAILEEKQKKTSVIIKEAFYGDFVQKDEAILRIQKEFVDTKKAPKTIDVEFLKENMDSIVNKVKSMTNEDVRITINTYESGSVVKGGAAPITPTMTTAPIENPEEVEVGEAVKPKKRGRPSKADAIRRTPQSETAPTDVNAVEKAREVAAADAVKRAKEQEENESPIQAVAGSDTTTEKTDEVEVPEAGEPQTDNGTEDYVKWSDVEKHMGETEDESTETTEEPVDTTAEQTEETTEETTEEQVETPPQEVIIGSTIRLEDDSREWTVDEILEDGRIVASNGKDMKLLSQDQFEVIETISEPAIEEITATETETETSEDEDEEDDEEEILAGLGGKLKGRGGRIGRIGQRMKGKGKPAWLTGQED